MADKNRETLLIAQVLIRQNKGSPQIPCHFGLPLQIVTILMHYIDNAYRVVVSLL